MNRTQDERRTNGRIGREYIPDKLRNVKVLLNRQQTVIGKVMDISLTGIALLLPVKKHAIKDYTITITTMDDAISIRDELVYVKFIDKEVSRVSLLFSSPNKAKVNKIFKKYLSTYIKKR